ncbi:kinase-like domain-containing protein, partial [Mycena rebaudengoi]
VDDFDVLAKIGQGSSCRVYAVRYKASGVLFALKVSPKHLQSSDVVHEQQLLQRFASLPGQSFLLPLVASWHDTANFYLLTPHCGGGDMATELAGKGKFAPQRVQYHMVQLVLAVEQLHKLYTLHRDVKPSNVFFNAHGDVVLGDYGFAKSFEEEEPTEINFEVSDDATCGSFSLGPSCVATDRCGTVYYMSSAQYAGDAYSFETDVWGLGMLMFRMLAGRLPFGANANTDAELRASYRDDPILFKDEEGLDDAAKDLISKMLTKDPTARATISEVKQHEYFNAVDWDTTALCAAPAPWTPRTPFIPKVARPVLIAQGTSYQDLADPLPGFAFVSPELFKPPPPAPVKRATWAECMRNVFKRKTPPSNFQVGPKTADASATVCGSVDGNKKTTPVRVLAPGTKTTTAKFSFARFFKRVFSVNLKAKDGSVRKLKDADKTNTKTFPTQSWTVPAGKNGVQQPVARSFLSRVMGWVRRHHRVRVEMGQPYRIDLTRC